MASLALLSTIFTCSPSFNQYFQCGGMGLLLYFRQIPIVFSWHKSVLSYFKAGEVKDIFAASAAKIVLTEGTSRFQALELHLKTYLRWPWPFPGAQRQRWLWVLSMAFLLTHFLLWCTTTSSSNSALPPYSTNTWLKIWRPVFKPVEVGGCRIRLTDGQMEQAMPFSNAKQQRCIFQCIGIRADSLVNSSLSEHPLTLSPQLEIENILDIA